ncbi:MAG: tRNA (N6-isopentenyl adenosine(37)-C2)-methylthiotransferase MiaB [Firmicutes bacterium]|nr:tRNA (N6-isopentenyl adenosine(37)-C2)-methylthiotransferase MiaB [Bacillota bacterium]
MSDQAKTYYLQIFGCQMNERDGETIAGLLESMGYERTEDREIANVIVIDTCSVRENADKRFFGFLGQLKRIRLSRPDVTVAACGCMMQQKHIVDTIKQKYPWVDIVFGTHNIHELPEMLSKVLESKKKIVNVWEEGGEPVEGLPFHRRYAFKAFVSIMYGCNNFCTYCIVPYTRGRERSRKPSEILKEIRELVADGVKEVTLLGQNVNSYKGADDGEEPLTFAGLIRKLSEIEGLERIRFMTSHPKDLSPELIQAYKDCPKLCPHIHLPVQSGSTEILRRMNRRYTKEGYLELVGRLREAVPGIAITTDIIVGFPGETEEDFAETLDLVRKVGYDSAFTFLYSPRKGTPAAEYEEQIPEDVKHERFNRLVDTVNSISVEKNRNCVGKIYPVLAEGPDQEGSALQSGRTPEHKLVNFEAPLSVTGQIDTVEITESNTFSLVGRMVE